jgi:hypothetical protein
MKSCEGDPHNTTLLIKKKQAKTRVQDELERHTGGGGGRRKKKRRISYLEFSHNDT